MRDPFADFPAVAAAVDAHRRPAGGARARSQGLGPGDGALLFGVTGSGKTLVYLEAVRRVLAAGRGAIVLVPEIGLTPQTVSRLRGAFGDQVAVLHSGALGRRARRRLAAAAPRRAAGGGRRPLARSSRRCGPRHHRRSTRSTRPATRTARAPRYHARDVAAVRARLEGASLVLGSATPSLETMARAATGLRLLRLPERIGARPLPPVELVDLRVAPKVAGTGAGRLVGGARRGHRRHARAPGAGAAAAQPPGLRRVPPVPRLRRGLAVPALQHLAHRAPAPAGTPLPLLRSRGAAARRPAAQCANPVQQMRGVGTQQLERLLAERYPGRPAGAHGPRHHQHQVVAPADPGAVGVGRGGPAARHADDRQGTRLSERDAGRAWWTRTPACTCPTSGPPSARSSCWRRWPGARGGGPRAGACWCRPGIRRITRWSGRRATTPRGSSREERALRESPPYPPATSLVNLLVSGRGRSRRSAAGPRSWRTGARALVEQVRAAGHAARAGARVRWPGSRTAGAGTCCSRGRPEALGRIVRYAARRLPRCEADVRVVIDRDPVSLL